MIYSPILIPTLNRYVHLKKCIESLQKNSWAKYSTLIVSVDYPPSSKYEEGYNKICEFLKGDIWGFSEVKIIKHSKNLGAYGNYSFLKREVSKYCDRYIFAEDDNEFSTNFIEYIDKGLEIFNDNSDIIAICANGIAYRKGQESNIALSQNFSAQGYGAWILKDKQLEQRINREYFENVCKNYKLIRKIYQKDISLFFAFKAALLREQQLYNLADGEIPIIDMTIKIYMILENKFVVCPWIQKSRNFGYDGSGVNCPETLNKCKDDIIDSELGFEYKYSYPIEVHEFNSKLSIEMYIRILYGYWKIFKHRIGKM